MQQQHSSGSRTSKYQSKFRKSCEGKMLSGYVKKYLGERGNFDTGVCQYTFGFQDDQENALPTACRETEIDTQGFAPTTRGSLKPFSGRQSMADQVTAISSSNRN